MADILNDELKARLDEGTAPTMIDVREPHEWDMDTLAGVEKISLGELPTRLAELEQYRDTELVMICRSGNRSGKATQFLQAQGFSNVRNLVGGMLGWQRDIDPDFAV